MMRVVSGALIRDGRVLMGLRKSNGLRPDLWELPGGKIEPGETRAAALKREWMEECACSVEVEDFVASAILRVETAVFIELYIVKADPTAKPRPWAYVTNERTYRWRIDVMKGLRGLWSCAEWQASQSR